MPIHDWTRVEAGIFHDFHHAWIEEIKRTLNRGLLPPEYYALAEQIVGGLGPDVLTLRRPGEVATIGDPATGIALLSAPPRVHYRGRAATDLYAGKAKTVVIRHTSRHQIIAMVEIVSPGTKNNRHGLRAFVKKAIEALEAGIHLLIVDLFPPGPRDPQGLHRSIWDELAEDGFTLPVDRPLTAAAYIGGPIPEAFVEPMAVGDPVPEMPLFLTPEVYIPVPLDATYLSAWEAVPAFWRAVLEKPPGT